MRASKAVYEKMKLFQENYMSYPDLRKALLNPVLSPRDKELLLSTSIGIDPEEAYMRAIRLLIKNHREKYLKTISLIYQRLYRETYGIAYVKVITATELTDELVGEIEEAVRQKVQGRSTEYEYIVDPSIIGGFILKTETRQYDASVKRELEMIGKKLLEN